MTQFGKQTVSSYLSSAIDITFRDNEYSLDGWGQSDNYAMVGSVQLFLEVENKQKHPSTNVTKYWPYLESKENQGIILIHAFSNESPGLNSSRGKLAEWVATKMEIEFDQRFKYFRLVFNNSENSISGIEELSQYIKSI